MIRAAIKMKPKPAIVPFWDRLPRFFLFPLLPANLVVIAALAIGSLLAFVLPVPAPVDIMLAEAIVWITALRHAFRVMDMTSYGRITVEAQQAQLEHDPDRVNLPWKMIALFIVWNIAIGFIEAASTTLGWIAEVLFAAATPAIIMQLCASNSLGSSLNPGTWLGYMRAIGSPYWSLCFFLLMLVMGVPTAFTLLLPLVSENVLLPATNFVCLYFNLIMFYMMGYVMYQYHDVLGLPALEIISDAEVENEAEPGIDAMIAARLAASEIDEAITIAKNAARAEPHSIAAQARLHTLLSTAGQTEKARQQGIHLFELCLSQGQAAHTIKLYQTLHTHAQPLALKADQILPLARLARQNRDYQFALDLVRGFDKRYPQHTDIPGVYYFSAQLVSEQFRQNDLARKILEGMLQRFPDHSLAGEAAHYLEVLRRMATTEPGRSPA